MIGSRLHEGALGAVSDLTPRMRTLLTEPGAVVVDESELERLGVAGVGGVAEVAGCRVRVVGLVRGLKSVGPPFVFCSLRTAYHAPAALPRLPPAHDVSAGPLPQPGGRPGRRPAPGPARSDLSAFTREEFSARTRELLGHQHRGRASAWGSRPC